MEYTFCFYKYISFREIRKLLSMAFHLHMHTHYYIQILLPEEFHMYNYGLYIIVTEGT